MIVSSNLLKVNENEVFSEYFGILPPTQVLSPNPKSSNKIGTLKNKVTANTLETCTANITTTSLSLKEYTPYKDDRGRGVLLYVHNSQDFTPCEDLNETYFTASYWGIVSVNKSDTLLVGAVYKSPSSTQKNQLKLLQVMTARLQKPKLYLPSSIEQIRNSRETGISLNKAHTH